MKQILIDDVGCGQNTKGIILSKIENGKGDHTEEKAQFGANLSDSGPRG